MTERATWRMRNNVWKPDEDELLTNLALYYIRNGLKQLDAFDEASAHLGRTSASCAFRWNGHLRKVHAELLEQAKQERQKCRPHMRNPYGLSAETIEMDGNAYSLGFFLQGIQLFAKQYEQMATEHRTMLETNKTLLNTIQLLQEERKDEQ